jgi:hypothetical protein
MVTVSLEFYYMLTSAVTKWWLARCHGRLSSDSLYSKSAGGLDFG